MVRIIALVLGGMLFCTAAFGNDAQVQIEQFKSMLETAAASDTTGAVAADRALVAKWLKEAEVLHASGNRDGAKKRLRRVELGMELVRALTATVEIRTAADEQEAAAHRAPETIASLKQEVEALQRRKAELERELQQLR